jgi:uncharacterized Zn-binding protein involved in type VI secretion
MPDAARIGDNHTCPVSDPKAHKGGPILTGERTVLIADKRAARVTDKAKCNGPVDKIVDGCNTVLIADKAAARVGDSTTHGGVIVEGCSTVLIGG